MLRQLTLGLLVLGVYLAVETPAQAQRRGTSTLRSPYTNRGNISGPFGRPLLSPYLNLLRGGNTAANFYAGVVPEQAARNNFAAMQNSIGLLDNEVAGLAAGAGAQGPDYYIDTLPGTGHRTYFGSPNSMIGQSAPAVRPTLLPQRSQRR